MQGYKALLTESFYPLKDERHKYCADGSNNYCPKILPDSLHADTKGKCCYNGYAPREIIGVVNGDVQDYHMRKRQDEWCQELMSTGPSVTVQPSGVDLLAAETVQNTDGDDGESNNAPADEGVDDVIRSAVAAFLVAAVDIDGDCCCDQNYERN